MWYDQKLCNYLSGCYRRESGRKWSETGVWLLSSEPQKDILVLKPRTCECDFIWEKGLFICNQIKDFCDQMILNTQVSPKPNDLLRDRRREARRQTS